LLHLQDAKQYTGFRHRRKHAKIEKKQAPNSERVTTSGRRHEDTEHQSHAGVDVLTKRNEFDATHAK
jgi:hypothetical protein